jgi:enterochelin esterase-like enzyme
VITVYSIGSSHGGLAAFHMALSHPAIYGIAICMSPSFWAGIDWLIGSSLTNRFYSLETSNLIQVNILKM